MATPVFAVVGHGNEEPVPFNDRPIVPEGYTVVLLTKPGLPYTGENAGRLWESMYYTPDLYRNPVVNKEEIEARTYNHLRIYEEGSPMPAMRYYPHAVHEGTKETNAAGIYKLPLSFPSIRAQGIMFEDLTKDKNRTLTAKEFQDLYSGNENRQIREKIIEVAGNPPSVQKIINKDFFYAIEDVLAMNGPGVYYFMNCRYVKIKQRIDNFVQRVFEDIEREIQELIALEPTDLDSPQHRRWAIELGGFDYLLSEFRNKLKYLRKPGGENFAATRLVEDKLPAIRKVLVERTSEEGNTVYKTYRFSDNSARAGYNIMRSLNVTKYNDYERAVGFLKKRYLKWFDDEFSPIMQFVPIARSRSEAGQAKYIRTVPAPTGGKRKSRRNKKNRKTRRRRV
jgi:hypothetical protein